MKPTNGRQGVTLRALIIAVILIPINCYWVVELEAIKYISHPTTVSLFYNAVFSILVLICLNLLLRKFLPKFALSQGELLVIYTMVSLASGMAGHDMLQILVPMLGHAFWFATPENEWASLFHRYLPDWLTVSDENVLSGYYRGEKSLYAAEEIRGWIEPVLWWTLFIFALVFVMLCINVIMRKRWIEQEKLSYPIVQLPLEMTREGPSFFRNKILWLGLSLAAGLDIFNGLHSIFPGVPEIHVTLRYYSIFTEEPWNAIGSVPLSFYPFAIGLGFFIPVGLSFSCWFFFWCWNALRIAGSAIGLSGLPDFPYSSAQGSGSYVALALLAIWTGRKHLKRAILKAVRLQNTVDDSAEPMRYRTALLGIVVGVAFIILFCWRGGMTVWAAIAFFAFYFAISIALTRMRAEIGVPMHDLHYSGPDEILVRIFGTRGLSKGTLGMASLFFFINRAYRSHPMPHQIEGFWLAKQTRSDVKRLTFAMMLAVVLGTISAFWILLNIGYHIGMELQSPWPSLTAFGRQPYSRFSNWLEFPSSTDFPASIAMVMGFLVTIFLMLMHTRFLWWPLHPVAFAISGCHGMEVFWSCLFISWLAKWVILKYGGLKVHRRVTPFFIGLILGDFTVGSLWTIIGVAFDMKVYSFY